MDYYVLTDTGPMLWGIRHGHSLLEELGAARRYVEFDDEASVDRVLEVITTLMSCLYRHQYDVPFIKCQFEILKETYELFNYVINFPHVTFESETNTMHIPYRVKAAILHERASAEKYMLCGEPLWEELKFLFDDPELWMNDPRIVEPDGEYGVYVIPNTFAIDNVPILDRMREREYKKISNLRYSMEE